MFAMIGGWLLSKLMGLVSGPLIEGALDLFNKDQDRNIRKDELDAETAKAAMAAYVGLEALRVEDNKNKMGNQIYWGFISLFIVPLGIYWVAIITDSIAPMNLNVATLPAEMHLWAGQMIQWLFYVSVPIIGIKTLMSK